MPKPTLYIRLYVEAADQDIAEAIAARMMPTVTAIAPIISQEIEPYWKIPEYYGIFWKFDPTGDVQAKFDQFIALSEAGWSGWWIEHPDDEVAPHEGRDAVWNPTPGVTLLAPEVRWGHVEVYFTSA
jgi:hypothetical protein